MNGGDTPGRSMASPVGPVAAVVVTVLVVALVWSGVGVGNVVGGVVVVPFLLLVPGYVILFAAVPAAVPFDRHETAGGVRSLADTEPTTTPSVARFADGIDPLERLVVSFALSIVVVPLVGYLVDLAGGAIRPLPVVLAVSAVTLLAAAVGLVRWRRAAAVGLRPAVRQWVTDATPARPTIPSPKNLALVVLMIAALGTAGASVSTIATTPDDGFTEFYVGNASASSDRAMESFTDPIEAGQPVPVRVTVENHELERTDYTLVVLRQRVDENGGVLGQTELRRESTTIDAGASWSDSHDVTPTASEDRVRVQYLLYVGDAPATPSESSADYDLHVWVSNGTASSLPA